MGWKPLSVIFFCSFCAAISGAFAADAAPVPGAVEADGAEGLPVAGGVPSALALSSLVLDMSAAGSFALSVSERLQLREQIRKAAQDIYSEHAGSPLRSEVSHLQGEKVHISP